MEGYTIDRNQLEIEIYLVSLAINILYIHLCLVEICLRYSYYMYLVILIEGFFSSISEAGTYP